MARVIPSRAVLRLVPALAAIASVFALAGAAHAQYSPSTSAPEVAALPPNAAVPPPLPPLDPASLRCLAQTIYFEARSEGPGVRRAVAHVVLNRVADPRFPDTICGVVHDGGTKRNACQFSWWCDGKSDTPFNKTAWAEALNIARQAARPDDPDPTGGALYYHDKSVHPAWARHKQRTATIGSDRFYQ